MEDIKRLEQVEAEIKCIKHGHKWTSNGRSDVRCHSTYRSFTVSRPYFKCTSCGLTRTAHYKLAREFDKVMSKLEKKFDDRR